VYEILFERDRGIETPPRNTEDVKNAYQPVVGILMSYPPQTPGMPIRVYWTEPTVYDDTPELNEPSYLDVVFVNPNYVAPPDGAKPWGGKSNDRFDAPEGYYNCNWDNYNQYFGMGLTPWVEMIDSIVIVENTDSVSLEEALATILYEITFYGWTPESVEKVVEELGSLKDSYFEEKDKGTLKTVDFDGLTES